MMPSQTCSPAAAALVGNAMELIRGVSIMWNDKRFSEAYASALGVLVQLGEIRKSLVFLMTPEDMARVDDGIENFKEAIAMMESGGETKH